MPTQAEDIKKKWTEGLQKRRTFDIEAHKNIALLLGEHYFTVNPVTRKIYKPDPKDDKTRLTIPLIKPLWRQEIAKLTKNRPIPEVLPTTPEEEDQQAAKMAQKALDSELDRLEFDEKLVRLWTWVGSIGLSYLHPTWNPKAGDGGDIELEVVPHLEMVMDPAVKNSTKEAMWAIRGTVLTQEAAYEKFGQEFKEDTTGMPEVWRSLQAGDLLGLGAPSNKGVLVLQMWHLPSRKYPKGAVVTVIGDKIVDGDTNEKSEKYKPFPYDHKELPFIDFHHVRIPGRFEGQSILRDLWSSQKDYNAARSRMAETRALLSAPKILSPRGAIQDLEKIGPEAGQIITYDAVGPFRPEPFQMPNVPTHLFQTTDIAMQELSDIAGSHEVSKGMLPSANIPAAAVMALQEADDTKLGPIVSGLEKGISRTGKQILSLVQQYWKKPRVIRVWSESEDKLALEHFAASEINKALDVRVVPGSALPRSKAELKQDVMQLWQQRVITDPKLVLKQLDQPALSQEFNKQDVATKKAHREHNKLTEGIPVVAERFDNHETHIAVHNEWRQTEEFEKLPDEVRAAVAAHVEEHEEIQRQLIMEAQPMPFPEAGLPAPETNGAAPTEVGVEGGGPYAGLGGNKAQPPDLPNVVGD